MQLEQRIQKLKQEIDLMSQVYAKGFGNIVLAAYLNSYVYLEVHGENEKDASRALIVKELEFIENHYQNVIPFEHIQGNKDYSSVFEVKELIVEYGSMIREFLDNPDEEKLNLISNMRTRIMSGGNTLRSKFKSKLEEIQQYPGFENYKVVLVDLNGHTWEMRRI